MTRAEAAAPGVYVAAMDGVALVALWKWPETALPAPSPTGLVTTNRGPPSGHPPRHYHQFAEPYGCSFGDLVAAGMHPNLHAFCMTTAAASGRKIVVVESPRGAIVSEGDTT